MVLNRDFIKCEAQIHTCVIRKKRRRKKSRCCDWRGDTKPREEKRDERPLFLAATASGRDIRGAHEVADILLQKLVVTVEFIVFFLDGLDTTEDAEERLLEELGVAFGRVSITFGLLGEKCREKK